ncbi:MAG: phosphotransferase [Chlamydiales bacterium]
MPVAAEYKWLYGKSLNLLKLTTEQIVRIVDFIASNQALDFLDKACAAKWKQAAVWIHSDVAIGNILIKDNKLSGVIDFGNTAIR